MNDTGDQGTKESSNYVFNSEEKMIFVYKFILPMTDTFLNTALRNAWNTALVCE